MRRFILLKKVQNNACQCSAFAFSALLYLFFTSNSAVFVDGEGGYKNIFCFRAQGTLATPLFTIDFFSDE